MSFLRRHRYWVVVPVALVITTLALLFVLGLGAEDEVAFLYQIF